MKKIVAAMMSIIMILSLTACGDSSSKKGSNPNLGCELSDYLFMDSKDKMDKFIEDNELIHDEENGDYYNHYISIELNEEGSAIVMATLSESGSKYTLYGISVGEVFDRDMVTSRLNRNNLPLISDEGDYIYYGATGLFIDGPAIAVRLNEDDTVGFMAYSCDGMDRFTSYADDTTEMTAIEIYTNFANQLNDESSIFHGSFTDKAMTFIDNHPDLFIGNDPENNSYNYLSTEAFEYKKYIKSPENYPLTIISDSEMDVYDITETNLDDGTCLTEGVLGAGIGIGEGVFYFIMIGSIDVYSGDGVSITALPLGYGSFENAAGDLTNCVYLAITHMESCNDYSYGYDY